MRTDNGGMFWETVFDVVSLAFSVADVIANPSDPWAWAGLIGDAVDVLVPFVSGVGETTKALKVANKVIRYLIQIPGEINGDRGVFEYIIDNQKFFRRLK